MFFIEQRVCFREHLLISARTLGGASATPLKEHGHTVHETTAHKPSEGVHKLAFLSNPEGAQKQEIEDQLKAVSDAVNNLASIFFAQIRVAPADGMALLDLNLDEQEELAQEAIFASIKRFINVSYTEWRELLSSGDEDEKKLAEVILKTENLTEISDVEAAIPEDVKYHRSIQLFLKYRKQLDALKQFDVGDRYEQAEIVVREKLEWAGLNMESASEKDRKKAIAIQKLNKAMSIFEGIATIGEMSKDEEMMKFADNLKLVRRKKAFEASADISARSILQIVDVLREDGKITEETIMVFCSYISEYASYAPQAVKRFAEFIMKALLDLNFKESYSYRGPETLTPSSSMFTMISVGVLAQFKKKVLDAQENGVPRSEDPFWNPIVEHIRAMSGVQTYIDAIDDVFAFIETKKHVSGHEFNKSLNDFLVAKGLYPIAFRIFAEEISKAYIEQTGYEVSEVQMGVVESIRKLQIFEDPTILQGGMLTPPVKEGEQPHYVNQLRELLPEEKEYIPDDIFNVFVVRSNGGNPEDRVFQTDDLNNPLYPEHFFLVPGVAQKNLLFTQYPELENIDPKQLDTSYRTMLPPYTKVKVQVKQEGNFMKYSVVDANNPATIYTEIKQSLNERDLKTRTPIVFSGDSLEPFDPADVLPHGDKFRFVSTTKLDKDALSSESRFNIKEFFQKGSIVKTPNGVLNRRILLEMVAQGVAAGGMKLYEKDAAVFQSENIEEDSGEIVTTQDDELITRAKVLSYKRGTLEAYTEVFVIRDGKEVSLMKGTVTARM